MVIPADFVVWLKIPPQQKMRNNNNKKAEDRSNQYQNRRLEQYPTLSNKIGRNIRGTAAQRIPRNNFEGLLPNIKGDWACSATFFRSPGPLLLCVLELVRLLCIQSQFMMIDKKARAKTDLSVCAAAPRDEEKTNWFVCMARREKKLLEKKKKSLILWHGQRYDIMQTMAYLLPDGALEIGPKKSGWVWNCLSLKEGFLSPIEHFPISVPQLYQRISCSSETSTDGRVFWNTSSGYKDENRDPFSFFGEKVVVGYGVCLLFPCFPTEHLTILDPRKTSIDVSWTTYTKFANRHISKL